MSEDHPFIKQARRDLDIPEDADFLQAFTSKWVAHADPQGRKMDLAKFDEAQQGNTFLRSETQLAMTRLRLRKIDERLRRTWQ